MQDRLPGILTPNGNVGGHANANANAVANADAEPGLDGRYQTGFYSSGAHAQAGVGHAGFTSGGGDSADTFNSFNNIVNDALNDGRYRQQQQQPQQTGFSRPGSYGNLLVTDSNSLDGRLQVGTVAEVDSTSYGLAQEQQQQQQQQQPQPQQHDPGTSSELAALVPGKARVSSLPTGGQSGFGQVFGLTGSRLPTTSHSSPTYNTDGDSSVRAPDAGPTVTRLTADQQQQQRRRRPVPTSPSLPASAGLSKLPVSVITNGVFSGFGGGANGAVPAAAPAVVRNPFLRDKRKVAQKWQHNNYDGREDAGGKKVTLIQDEYFVPSRWPRVPYNADFGGVRVSDTEVGLAKIKDLRRRRKDDIAYDDDDDGGALLTSGEVEGGASPINHGNFLPSEKIFLLLNERISNYLGERRVDDEDEGRRRRKSLGGNPARESNAKEAAERVASSLEDYDTLQSPLPPSASPSSGEGKQGAEEEAFHNQIYQSAGRLRQPRRRRTFKQGTWTKW